MLEIDTSPRKYFPKVYDNTLEIDEIALAEDHLFKEALQSLDSLWKNSFILTCDESGIELYERILKIIPNPTTESLTFRKNRVLNRFAMIPSFTMPWLKVRLDELLGKGNWGYEINYARRELIIEIASTSSAWLHEIGVTVHQVKPANMVFLSRPLQAFNLLVSDEVSIQNRIDHYRLGTWSLGSKPFTEFLNEEVVKMAETPSVQSALLRHVAAFTAQDVASVLVNNTYRIPRSKFIDASSSEGLVHIEYEVLSGEGLGTITNVKLQDSLGETLIEMNVVIDNTFNVRMNHKIRFQEGINAETT